MFKNHKYLILGWILAILGIALSFVFLHVPFSIISTVLILEFAMSFSIVYGGVVISENLLTLQANAENIKEEQLLIKNNLKICHQNITTLHKSISTDKKLEKKNIQTEIKKDHYKGLNKSIPTTITNKSSEVPPGKKHKWKLNKFKQNEFVDDDKKT